jgi:hypothetical protein
VPTLKSHPLLFLDVLIYCSIFLVCLASQNRLTLEGQELFIYLFYKFVGPNGRGKGDSN